MLSPPTGRMSPETAKFFRQIKKNSGRFPKNFQCLAFERNLCYNKQESISETGGIIMNKTTDELLWYTKEAPDFNSALPVGNGRMGAMIYGGASKDVMKLNEDSVYSGGKRNRINPRAFEGLQEIRRLLEKEEIEEAEKIAFRKMQGVTPNSRLHRKGQRI